MFLSGFVAGAVCLFVVMMLVRKTRESTPEWVHRAMDDLPRMVVRDCRVSQDEQGRMVIEPNLCRRCAARDEPNLCKGDDT